jgi:hypothetical protein
LLVYVLYLHFGINTRLNCRGLQHQNPFRNTLSTRLVEVKDIPYFVTDRFLQTYHRNRYQLGQVEVMVEKAYEQYLVDACKKQVTYKRKLEKADASGATGSLERAKSFELSRCSELDDLFPSRRKDKGRFA